MGNRRDDLRIRHNGRENCPRATQHSRVWRADVVVAATGAETRRVDGGYRYHSNGVVAHVFMAISAGCPSGRSPFRISVGVAVALRGRRDRTRANRPNHCSDQLIRILRRSGRGA
jgi:hypothetical protein